MAQQTINLGATGTGAGGDDARTAFVKIMANFAELYIAALPGTAAQKQAARDMFGLGSAATKAAQASATDTTAGALMAVGAFGLGAGGITAVPGGNVDTLTIPGFYFVGGSLGGTVPSSLGLLQHIERWSSGQAVQFFDTLRSAGGAQLLYTRTRRSDSTWTPWAMVYTQANILGTVSQVGGVPTGAIIERNSNANGAYVRFADGTQICERTIFTIGGWSAGLTLERGWTFPAPFATTDGLFAAHNHISEPGASVSTTGWDSWLHTLSATGASFGVKNTGSVAQANSAQTQFAIGRWYA